jgi:hypothetical protein
MNTMSDGMRNELRRILNPQQPFGPPDAGQFTSNVDLLRMLYDADNRIHRETVKSGAPYVIGRKGAGKTAFVMAPKLLPNARAVELPSADVYQGVFGVIGLMNRRQLKLLPEQSARLWRHLTWCAVLSALARDGHVKGPAGRTVNEFATALGEGTVPKTADLAVSNYLRRLTALIDSSTHLGGVGEFLNSVTGNGWSVDEAIEAGTEVLRNLQPTRFVVIVDSLERYAGVLPTSQYDEVESSAFEGLFRFVGGDGTQSRSPFDIRFAFPAELWSILEKVSSNPIKDFHQRVIAHWSAKELVSLVGTRLALYCALHNYENKLTRAPLEEPFTSFSYDESRQLLTSIFPSEIKNGFGLREDLFGYLLRHTQLLPRHLITILNRVLEAQFAADDGEMIVGNDAVVEGVRRGETEVVNDILAAYRQVHPMARVCCERVLPNVGMMFGDSELHRSFNHGGVRAATNLDYRDMVRCLVEIGCLGRVTESDSGVRYIGGEFEYTRPGSLFIGADESYCLHPLFAEVFNCAQSAGRRKQMTASQRSEVRPVYPTGTDPDIEVDYRDVT